MTVVSGISERFALPFRIYLFASKNQLSLVIYLVPCSLFDANHHNMSRKQWFVVVYQMSSDKVLVGEHGV